MINSVDKGTVFSANKSLQCGNKTLSFCKPLIMGILNITPDSFFDGGSYTTLDLQLRQAEKMIAEGADIIDIGAVSTRPGSISPDEETELRMILPVIEKLVNEFPETVFSVDTFRGKVAIEVAQRGAGIINDISGGTLDEAMLTSVAETKLPYILQHIKGNPLNMQQNPEYEDIISEVNIYFKEKIEFLNKLGIQQIIVDPGFGFGKKLHHNYTLLREMKSFVSFDLPILVGVSRKSMIYKLLEITPQEALVGTAMLNLLAILNGANILRVHDVKAAKQAIRIAEAYLGGE